MPNVPEIYVKMAVGFDEDPKVIALQQFGGDAPAARDLFQAMIRFCRRNLSDGFVPEFAAHRLIPPLGMPDAERIAMHLVSVGLVEKCSESPVNCYRVCRYVTRNGTRADAEAKSAAAREAALSRWSGNHDSGTHTGLHYEPHTGPLYDMQSGVNADRTAKTMPSQSHTSHTGPHPARTPAPPPVRTVLSHSQDPQPGTAGRGAALARQLLTAAQSDPPGTSDADTRQPPGNTPLTVPTAEADDAPDPDSDGDDGVPF
jgi:hypothetical protein